VRWMAVDRRGCQPPIYEIIFCTQAGSHPGLVSGSLVN
jgi:hypothetical protein